jgi:hypothetical protein
MILILEVDPPIIALCFWSYTFSLAFQVEFFLSLIFHLDVFAARTWKNSLKMVAGSFSIWKPVIPNQISLKSLIKA